MDAPIALALMEKARRVFERQGTFLSFPVAAQISYKPEDLRFLTGDISTELDQLQLAQFCRLVNLLPEGRVWPPAEERYLWNVYENLMKSNVHLAA